MGWMAGRLPHALQFGQLGQCPLALDGVHGHLGLDQRRVIPAGSLAHGHPAFSGLRHGLLSQSFHFSLYSDFRRHLSGFRGGRALRHGICIQVLCAVTEPQNWVHESPKKYIDCFTLRAASYTCF